LPQTVLPKAKVVNMSVVDCKIEESLADNNINIDITKTRLVNVCCYYSNSKTHLISDTCTNSICTNLYY
jgi:hypothetical protein